MLERLKKDLTAAMKRRDPATVGVLRLLLADLHNRKIAAGKDLSEDEIVAALRTAVKQRSEAAEQFSAGGRKDRAAAERAEIVVIQGYLPAVLGDHELGDAIDEIIDATGATSIAEMGKVMSQLMAKHKGKVDGKLANQLVRERLAGAAPDEPEASA